MNNVIQLFAQKNVEVVLSDAETSIATSFTSVLASSVQLAHTVKELSNHFDAIENAIDAIDDTETRNRLNQSTKLSRETLTKAMLELFRQIAKLPGLQIRAAWKQ
jgi:uncharacterized phage infection (PIP) family protein YhgE